MQTVTSEDGTKIAYDRIGHGSSLILVDGAFCFRKSGTTPMLMPLLSQHFTVYAYDRRGRGESENSEPYAVEREIEDLKAMMDAAGGAASVLGMSSGAALALEAAACGLGVKKLALFEPPYVAASKDDPLPPTDAIAQLNQMIAADRGVSISVVSEGEQHFV